MCKTNVCNIKITCGNYFPKIDQFLFLYFMCFFSCKIDSSKSDSDKNEYRLIKLSNGLKELLIKSSNPFFDEEEPAAVCLKVRVGFLMIQN